MAKKIVDISEENLEFCEQHKKSTNLSFAGIVNQAIYEFKHKYK